MKRRGLHVWGFRLGRARADGWRSLALAGWLESCWRAIRRLECWGLAAGGGVVGRLEPALEVPMSAEGAEDPLGMH